MQGVPLRGPARHPNILRVQRRHTVCVRRRAFEEIAIVAVAHHAMRALGQCLPVGGKGVEMLKDRLAILHLLLQKRAVAGHAQILICGLEDGACVEGISCDLVVVNRVVAMVRID